MGGSCQVYSKESAKKGSVKPPWMSQKKFQNEGDNLSFRSNRGFSNRWEKALKPQTCNSLSRENSQQVSKVNAGDETTKIGKCYSNKKSARVPCLDVWTLL